VRPVLAEQPFTTFLMNGRNELYPNPFDEFDPHHTMRGKKAFNTNERCLKTNINLENHTELLPKK
jgi:hypothetical protein